MALSINPNAILGISVEAATRAKSRLDRFEIPSYALIWVPNVRWPSKLCMAGFGRLF